MLVGYSCASTNIEELMAQQKALMNEGCQCIFYEDSIDRENKRPGLDNALKVSHSGDTMVIWDIESLGQTSKTQSAVLYLLNSKNIKLKVIKEQILYTAPVQAMFKPTKSLASADQRDASETHLPSSFGPPNTVLQDISSSKGVGLVGNIESEPSNDTSCSPPKDIEEVIKENIAYLRGFITRRVQEKQNVEDILQDTLLEAIKCYGNFQGKSQAKTWLCGIANNILKQHIKSKRKDEAFSSIDDPLFDIDQSNSLCSIGNIKTENPETIFERDAMLKSTNNKYLLMTKSIQDTVNSVIIEGNSYKDTAANFNVPLGTIRSRMANARKIFRSVAEA